jgi:hypothetical protein
MVKRCVFFTVRTEFLNTIYASFGIKGLKNKCKIGLRAMKEKIRREKGHKRMQETT